MIRNEEWLKNMKKKKTRKEKRNIIRTKEICKKKYE